jgi:hypothetical protein
MIIALHRYEFIFSFLYEDEYVCEMSTLLAIKIIKNFMIFFFKSTTSLAKHFIHFCCFRVTKFKSSKVWSIILKFIAKTCNNMNIQKQIEDKI